MTKNILGLDLGVTSIGWAFVKESLSDDEESSIVQIGVRVNPLTTDEQRDFQKEKPISLNAARTLKRGARRNLDRYQDRRANLIGVLLKANVIAKDSLLAEYGKNTTHTTWELRAKAVTTKIEKVEFARVLLAINKKRGYKSSRKILNATDGEAIDGMDLAKELYEENITPGQLIYRNLKEGKNSIPRFYRSDLKAEFEKVWDFQKRFFPDILTDELKKELEGKGQKETSASFWKKYQFNIAENKGSRDEKRIRSYRWRSEALTRQLTKEEVAYVIVEINNNIRNSSGYLGSISDRSKELWFKKQTIGQYLYQKLQANPHMRLKSQVFYRQDYLDEFEILWSEQAKYHSELTDELKEQIRDRIIFYQRRLKSQKGLISFCEFENKVVRFEKDGRQVEKTIGLKVAPKSSPLFQEFKIWQNLNRLEFKNKRTTEKVVPDLETKQLMFNELNVKGSLTAKQVIGIIGYSPKDWEINYKLVEGNRTNEALYEAYFKILELEGYDVKDLLNVTTSKDGFDPASLNVSASKMRSLVREIFATLGIDTAILEFDAGLEGKDFEEQVSYQLWHLLYSYEADDSATGNERLYQLLYNKFGFKPDHSRILGNIRLSDDYGNLSSKAMRKIYVYIKENNFSTACELAGYRHSKLSLTKEENLNRKLNDKLDLLKKNSLRNPVVEKILNQMVNLVNELIEKYSKRDGDGNIVEYFRFDEVRIELARELKKNAKERAEMTANISAAKLAYEVIVGLLRTEFGIKNPTRNDIIRYRLYEELKNNGYKDLYTNRYIPRDILFSSNIDIDHIIPQSKLFDDSFSNKTIIYRQVNLKKGNKTAYDFINSNYDNMELERFEERVEGLFELGKKNKEDGISRAKYQKLLKKELDIGGGFIERDLRDSQYIAKKAKSMLFEITPAVVTTTGAVTARLREDWDLMNIMQELNFKKFQEAGLTEFVDRKDGTARERIVNWSKRNDHRHHAMDAITIAFTKHSHIQYLNFLNARKNENHRLHRSIIGIETKETETVVDSDGNKRRRFKMPIPNFRQLAKRKLENVLVSHKAKNKVTTKNKNIIKLKNGRMEQIGLTPRGQLHKEMIYGKYHYYQNKKEKVGPKLGLEAVKSVGNPIYKRALLQRLADNENDPKRAFGGSNRIDKKPIFLDNEHMKILSDRVTVSSLKEDYSIRKEVTPMNFSNEKVIDKILDLGIREILRERLRGCGGDPKKAFSDLERNPIWLNEKKGIAIKRVAISGVNNAEPLHFKRDHFGNMLVDVDGSEIPSDFVSTGNNHHVAVYCDGKNTFREKVVSFFEAVERVRQRLPVIDKTFNRDLGWRFLFSMKQNEMFVFSNRLTGFDPNEIDLCDPKNYEDISPNLFRVQKLTVGDYWFRHHLETTVDVNSRLVDVTYKRLGLNGITDMKKVRMNSLGEIVGVGEY